MDKYTLFWSQNVNPNTPNTIGIDGEIYFYKPDPELDEAVLFLMDSCWDKLFKKTVSFSKICNDYDVPDNFILIWDKEKGLLIQSVFQNRDESGRPLTFRLWCRRVSISVACESLQKYAELSGKKLRDNEVNNIINITNKINEKIKEVKEGKRRKKKINKIRFLIIGLIISIFILFIWKSCCMDKSYRLNKMNVQEIIVGKKMQDFLTKTYK